MLISVVLRRLLRSVWDGGSLYLDKVQVFRLSDFFCLRILRRMLISVALRRLVTSVWDGGSLFLEECLKRGLMTRQCSSFWIKLNSDKRPLFAVENKKKHHKSM